VVLAGGRLNTELQGVMVSTDQKSVELDSFTHVTEPFRSFRCRFWKYFAGKNLLEFFELLGSIAPMV